MPIHNEITGNLIDHARTGDYWGIVHGCNCLKNWGAGLAKAMVDFAPAAHQADMENPNPTMGHYTLGISKGGVMVFNLYTQFYPGNNHWCKDSNENRYKAIEECFSRLNKDWPGKHLCIPTIASGLAGLKWGKISKIINDNTPDLKITLTRL